MWKQRGIVVLCVLAIVCYNDLFLRTHPGSDLVERVNPVPYLVHYKADKQKPNAVFQAPVFPQYNDYCQSSKKSCQFMPFQALYTDLLWIGTIQYVGSQPALTDNLGLYTLLNTITTLSPFWEYPYIFGELTIPMQKTLEEITSGSSSETLEQKESRNDALLLAQKGEHFLCDQKKIFAITGTTEEEFIDTMSNTSSKDLLKNPCPHYELPHFMAFNYFNFLSDPQDAADQYKISAFHDDAPSLTATIPALIYGRAGEHLKGATLWYDRYLSLTDDENQENSAVVALSKAIFEMQLELISEGADSHPECGTSYECLEQKGAIQESITHSRKDLCQEGNNTQNIRCILVSAGISGKFIGLDGSLIYPGSTHFQFTRSTDYNSRRAVPSK